MLRGGGALATVFLCLFVLVLSREPPQCSQDVIRTVVALVTKAPRLSWLDSRLYTPSTSDSKNCPASTLYCFAAELEVLFKEWEKVGEKVHLKLIKMLQRLAKSIIETEAGRPESDCRQCELLPEETAENFLNALLSTLQYVRSRFCPAARNTGQKRVGDF